MNSKTSKKTIKIREENFRKFAHLYKEREISKGNFLNRIFKKEMSLESVYFTIIFGHHDPIVKLLDLICKYLQYRLILTLQRFQIFM